MTEQEKLRVLLAHWIEHNREHADQFRRRAPMAGQSAGEIEAAADAMILANQHLAAALKALGGTVETAPHH
ncbi:MAG: hypothetical protein HY899_16955 [Deltaproteobacteria bacterium]|nr:hypothetical protein [Deltaproteobacteria bacterium]